MPKLALTPGPSKAGLSIFGSANSWTTGVSSYSSYRLFHTGPCVMSSIRGLEGVGEVDSFEVLEEGFMGVSR